MLTYTNINYYYLQNWLWTYKIVSIVTVRSFLRFPRDSAILKNASAVTNLWPKKVSNLTAKVRCFVTNANSMSCQRRSTVKSVVHIINKSMSPRRARYSCTMRWIKTERRTKLSAKYNELSKDEKFAYDIHQIRLGLSEMNQSLQGIQSTIRKFVEAQNWSSTITEWS